MKQKDFDESIFGIINPSVVCFQSHSYLIQLYRLSADDGSFYFDEKLVDAREHQGTLSTTSSVVRGFTAFASVTSGSINVSGSILVLQDFMLPIRTKKKKKILEYLLMLQFWVAGFWRQNIGFGKILPWYWNSWQFQRLLQPNRLISLLGKQQASAFLTVFCFLLFLCIILIRWYYTCFYGEVFHL